MPPHSLLQACSAGVPCCVQSHATSQSLRACSKCTTLLCSEPCHLTVSYEPVRLVCPAVFRAMPPHSLFEPVRLVCPAAFRAMPPHSLLRACSAGVPCCVQSHATSQSLRACSAGVPCCVQSHATSQSLTSLFGWCALRHSEPCHLTVSYEPVRCGVSAV